MLTSVLLSISLLVLPQVVSGDCANRSFTTCEDGIVHWYNPNTGEVCDPLDCGGGRAPPKTDVPGCANYKGTELPVTTTSYLSCFKPSASATPTVDTSSSAEPTKETVSAEPSTSVEIPSSTSISASPSTEETTGSNTASASPSTTPPATQSTEELTGSTDIPATTPPAGLSTQVQPSGNGSIPATGTPSPTAAPNAGSLLRGSLMAVAGVAIGAFALA